MAMYIADAFDMGYVIIGSVASLEKYADKPTVIEFDTLSPKEFYALEYKDKFKVAFMGFATVPAENLFDFWVNSGYQKNTGLSDEELVQFSEAVVSIGKRNRDECEELGYRFFDISDLKANRSNSPYASEVWEYLFGEKREIDLGKKLKFDI